MISQLPHTNCPPPYGRDTPGCPLKTNTEARQYLKALPYFSIINKQYWFVKKPEPVVQCKFQPKIGAWKQARRGPLQHHA